MNRIEKFVYDTVKGSPRVKLALRDLYQSVFDVVPTKRCESPYEITTREGYFFGFHDLLPFSADNKRLLANKYDIPLRMPRPDDRLVVGYFDGPTFEKFHAVSHTYAWNWHQGCRLQWRGDSSMLVFNDHEDGRNVARMVDVVSGKTETLPGSVGTVSGDGRWGVGYSFERVNRYMPGYGYTFEAGEPELEAERPDASGLYVIDLETMEQRTLFSIKEITQLQPIESMEGAFHYFTHTLFSPSSDRFVFLHRWVHGDVRKRWSRMISCDVHGNNVYVFPTHEMVSHIGWRGDQHVLAYCRLRDEGDRYVLFQDQAPEDLLVIGRDTFRSDGHPSFSPDHRWIVTDTYPDRTRRQRLILFDVEAGERYDIARVKAPKQFASTSPYRHWQCDLHPRWDCQGRYVCFDSTYTGRRALCTIDLGRVDRAHPPLTI